MEINLSRKEPELEFTLFPLTCGRDFRYLSCQHENYSEEPCCGHVIQCFFIFVTLKSLRYISIYPISYSVSSIILKKIFFLPMPCGMQDFSSPTRDQTCAPAVEIQSVNYWITREVP